MSGYRCSIASCTNTYRNTRLEKRVVKFHRFPKNTTINQLWMERCQKAGKWSSDNCRICSEHFTELDYDRVVPPELINVQMKRFLKPTAVPSLRLPKDDTNKNCDHSNNANASSDIKTENVLVFTAKDTSTPSTSQGTSNIVNMNLLPVERLDIKAEPVVVSSTATRKRKGPPSFTPEQEEYLKQQKTLNNIAAQTSHQTKVIQMEKTIQQLETKNKSLFAKCMELSTTNKALIEENGELQNKLKSLDENFQKTDIKLTSGMQPKNNSDSWDKYPLGTLNTETLAAIWKEVSTIPVPKCTCTKGHPYINRKPPRPHKY